MKRIASISLVLLALIAVLFFYLRAHSEAAKRQPAGAVHAAGNRTADPQHAAIDSARKAAAPAMWASATSTQIDLDFHETKHKAESGDPVAQRKLAQMYERCIMYSQSPQNFRGLMALFAKQDVEHAKRYAEVAERVSHYCDSIDGGKPIPSEAYQLWYAEAARRGDVIAQIKVATTVEHQPNEETYRALVAKAFESRDPEAIFAIGNMLSLAKTSVDLGSYASQMGGDYAEHAWELAACRAGAACGYGSYRMDAACSSGMCSNASGYESLIKYHFVPPGQQKFLEQDVERIRFLLRQANRDKPTESG
ncbi:hypothetical protein VC218_00115 [Xanthomonas nasturtii]|uniref:hypothetical protein n=1 Tax=Xanthomonas nasturtii TaxID=1843581 RepID=UPI002B227B3A|nr:hypothetical protein [Xanthomonas nasturtii]MEA9577375.1 hypothetical protein [Xanthomonas nasturtii]